MGNTYSKIYLHFVWTPKYRSPIIKNKMEKWLRYFIKSYVYGLDARLICFNMVEDHLHLLVKILPKTNIVKFIKDLKGGSSRLAKEEIQEYLRWQEGYAVFSVSENQVEMISNYIKNQKQKHQLARELIPWSRDK